MMSLRKYGDFYMDVEKILYVHKFPAKVAPMSMIKAGAPTQGGVRIGFSHGEVTIMEDDPGYKEFVDWLEGEEK
jgi:hypothetical protein